MILGNALSIAFLYPLLERDASQRQLRMTRESAILSDCIKLKPRARGGQSLKARLLRRQKFIASSQWRIRSRCHREAVKRPWRSHHSERVGISPSRLSPKGITARLLRCARNDLIRRGGLTPFDTTPKTTEKQPACHREPKAKRSWFWSLWVESRGGLSYLLDWGKIASLRSQWLIGEKRLPRRAAPSSQWLIGEKRLLSATFNL